MKYLDLKQFVLQIGSLNRWVDEGLIPEWFIRRDYKFRSFFASNTQVEKEKLVRTLFLEQTNIFCCYLNTYNLSGISMTLQNVFLGWPFEQGGNSTAFTIVTTN